MNAETPRDNYYVLDAYENRTVEEIIYVPCAPVPAP